MGINNQLYDHFSGRGWNPHEEDALLSGLLRENISFAHKKIMAKKFIEISVNEHNKKELYEQFKVLAEVEQGIGKLKPDARDHIVHAVLCYLLGSYVHEVGLIGLQHLNLFTWKMACFFHDIGYPPQLAHSIPAPLLSNIRKLQIEVSATDVRRPLFKLQLAEIENLLNGENAQLLIQTQISRWGLDLNVADIIRDIYEEGKVCHGVVSSLVFLYVSDLLFQKYNSKREVGHVPHEETRTNWDQNIFLNQIVPASAAIFLHALKPEHFGEARINRERAPEAFLLRLADCFQDWDRPSADRKKGYPQDSYRIEIGENRIVYYAHEKRFAGIEDEIRKTLDAPDVTILPITEYRG